MCRLEELCRKDIINVNDGCRLGNMNDVEINMDSGNIDGIVIYGKPRFFGILGRDDDTIIPWASIQKIGEDSILVAYDAPYQHRYRKKRQLLNIFK